MESNYIDITPVLPSQDIARDCAWYEQNLGFETRHADDMYAILRRDHLYIHLQWHADTADDPLLGGSVIRIFVKDIQSAFEDCLARGAIRPEKLRMNTPWGTHEFGMYDPNHNAIFVVQDAHK